MAAGIVFGIATPQWAAKLTFISDIFLRLIKSIIAPVIVGVLIRSIAGAGSMGALGRLGWKSIVYFEVSTTIALLLGWFTVLLLQPGVGLEIPAASGASDTTARLAEALENAFPTSIFDAMARGDVVQIVVFCALFGLACLSVGDKAQPVVSFAKALAEVAFRYTDYVMYLAPAAVFAASANTAANSGEGTLEGLATFVIAAWVVQSLFLVVVQVGGLALFGVPLRRFAHFARKPFAIAFGTTSSAAALPQTLDDIQKFGVPKRIIGVVTPLSLTLNMNGSTIHIAMGALFIAQATGIGLSLSQQLIILLTLKLTSKGVAGIPRGNFVILAALFEGHGFPMEGLAILLGIDALIDPVRTSVNVIGHCAAPAVVARWEGVTFPSDNSVRRA